jgi:hypothetical protein
LIDQYDARHAAAEQRLERLAEKFGEGLAAINVKLAALEVRAAEVLALRAQVETSVRQLAVLEDRQLKLKGDVNEAYKKLRSFGAP